jgi:NADPH:quinone reductase-like Zn-dependent oxidoreductase
MAADKSVRLEPSKRLGEHLAGDAADQLNQLAMAHRDRTCSWHRRVPAGSYRKPSLGAAPALHLARKPASLSHVEASAVPSVGLTAWQGLVDLGGVTKGDRVLVHGGGGGVGHVAIQVAKSLGAHVIATASGSKREFVEGLGADEVIDYTAVDFMDAVSDIDVVLDTIGGDTVERSLNVLRPGVTW